MHMPPVLELRDITTAFPCVLANDAIDLARIANPERARRALQAEVVELRAQERRIDAERGQIAADMPSRSWIWKSLVNPSWRTGSARASTIPRRRDLNLQRVSAGCDDAGGLAWQPTQRYTACPRDTHRNLAAVGCSGAPEQTSAPPYHSCPHRNL